MPRNAELLLLGMTAELQAAIARAVKDVGTITQSIQDYKRANELTNGVADQIVLVDIDSNPEQGFQAVSALAAMHPSWPIVVVSRSKDSSLVLRAMRAGARDYAILEPDLKDVVRATTTLASDAASSHPCTVITIFPAKGGVGATTLATNLAGMISTRRSARVMLLDLNLEMGDALAFLDLSSKYSIADALRNLQRLDAELLLDVMPVHAPSNVHVLAQTDRLEDADEVTPERVTALLKFLRKHYDVIIVDGLRGLDGASLSALDASDRIVLLLTQDIPAIKNGRRCLDVFSRLEYAPDRILVVLNRYQKSQDIDVTAIEETLHTRVTAKIANDFPAVMSAINRGRLLYDSAPRAKVTDDITSLAAVVMSEEEEPLTRKGILSGLFSRVKGVR